MKTTVLIPVKELKAMLLFTCKDSCRVAIGGVRVEVRPNKILLIATDGRRIVCLASEGGCVHSGDKTGEFTVPNESLERLLRAGIRKASVVVIDVEDNRISLGLRTHDDDDRLTCRVHSKMIEGNFPHWRQVVPPMNEKTTWENPTFSINPAYVADFAKAAALLHQKNTGIKVFLGKTELNPAVIRIDRVPNFYGLLMLMRFDYGAGNNRPPSSEAQPPDWLDMPLPNGFLRMDSAPMDCTWVIVQLADGTEVEAHFAQNLSGEEQPPFSGWFKRSENSDTMIDVGKPVAWKPIPKPEEPQPYPTTEI